LTSTFLRRTSNIYHAHKRNAREAGIELPYSLQQLRELIQQALGEPCPHCGETLKPSNVSIDHGNPTSRNGAHAIGNLVIMCETCNQRKGSLTTTEYSALLTLMVDWPAPAKQSVLRRLRAGGRFTNN
jgi:5-methylcytosine-specific restriction endonuclease McrA